MIITQTITKKTLETIVQKTFSNFGNLYCSSLLDSLKLLGFYYATNAGISINIEDLKTPNVKTDFLNIANEEMTFVSEQWQQGYVSDTERFQTIIDSWNVATESLKNRIIEYYENFDPANNLYIMAFSGARGNMSQVRQLVGMRGLMSDQEGKIIDLPIQANFREGLSSIDYIISSYGARKGIVDTALKTADSGYLTRRLIYIAQDLVIREKDCFTKVGTIFLVNKKTNIKNLLGRSILSINSLKFPYQSINIDKKSNSFFSEEKEKELKPFFPVSLNLRSSLTCKSKGSICQICYGWDLAHNEIISLGEAVGIIAAQSIGEPGTQLTMRTFHTGGIFTSESLKQIIAPYSGKITIPKSLKSVIYRTNHGILVSKLQQEVFLTLTNWKGLKEEIFLDIGSFLYLKNSSFIKKGQLISEYSTQSIVPGGRKLKPIYTQMSGEIKFENLALLNTSREKRMIKITQDDGIIWIASGKILSVPKEINTFFGLTLQKNKPFGNLKVVSPYDGIFSFNEKNVILSTKDGQFELNISNFSKKFPNCIAKLSLSVKNYQYIDKYTVIGIINFYQMSDANIYSIKKKESKILDTYFFLTEDDVWKIYSEEINNYAFFNNKKNLVRSGHILNTTTKFNKSGFFFKKDGFQMIFQNTTPIFLSLGTIINYKKGDFVLENELFANLLNYTQQTEDIVQGLPKIEELIEARKPSIKLKSHLSLKPGIILNSSSLLKKCVIENDLIKCHMENSEELKRRGKTKDKSFIQILHSISIKEKIFVYNKRIVKLSLLPSVFSPQKVEKKEKKSEYKFIERRTGEALKIQGKSQYSTWILLEKGKEIDTNLYLYENKKLIPIETFSKDLIFENKKEIVKEHWISQTSKQEFILIEFLNPISLYTLPLSAKFILKSGDFVDIGEPITEGIIDIHELLNIFSKYHSNIDGTMFGVLRSLNKFQLLLVNSVQSIYQSQNVTISSKHIEIIIRQMTSKVVITESGDTPFLPGEVIRLSLLIQISKALKNNHLKKFYKTPKYEPLLLSTTNSSLNKDGFLSAAGFQETKRVLTKAAIEGNSDWLRGLKECVIVGRLIPAGSSFLNYKNYLDNVYLFKE
jgi:hypothetical protein